MPKQYTFKTTRHTIYLEDILDGVPPQDRSEFIRNMISVGLQYYNVSQVTPVPTVTQKTDIPQKTEALQRTDVTQKTEVRQKTEVTPVLEMPSMEEMGVEVELGDLDSKLDNLY